MSRSLVALGGLPRTSDGAIRWLHLNHATTAPQRGTNEAWAFPSGMRAALSSRRHGWAYGRPRSPARARRSHGRRPHGGANPRPVTRTRISSEGRPSRARARTPTLGKLTATRASHPVASGAPTSRPAGQPQVRRIREVARVRQPFGSRDGSKQARVGSRIAPPRSQPGGDPLVATSRRAPGRARTEPTSRRLAPATSASSSGEGWPDSSAGRPPKAAGESPNQIWKRQNPSPGRRPCYGSTRARYRDRGRRPCPAPTQRPPPH
jgi:hypothetical protein